MVQLGARFEKIPFLFAPFAVHQHKNQSPHTTNIVQVIYYHFFKKYEKNHIFFLLHLNDPYGMKGYLFFLNVICMHPSQADLEVKDSESINLNLEIKQKVNNIGCLNDMMAGNPRGGALSTIAAAENLKCPSGHLGFFPDHFTGAPLRFTNTKNVTC